jgi:hypothetical protein
MKINIFNIHGGIGDILYAYNPIKNNYNSNNINIILTHNNNKINKTFINILFKDILKNLYFFNKKFDTEIYNNILKKYLNLKINNFNFRPNTKIEYYNYLTLPNFHNKINFTIDSKKSLNMYHNLIKKKGNNYILIHERPKDNRSNDIKPINRNYFINKKLPVYNFDFDSKENYNIKSNLIFDYYDIIINAQEIHVYNGSLLCLLDRLNYNLKNVFLHSYCKDIHKKIDFMNWIKEWNNKGLTFKSEFKVIN